jgi:Circularly permutated YpsA SLOG family
VRDSHATLILICGDELNRSPGTLFTKQVAELVFLRPCLVVDLSQSASVDRASEWFARIIAALEAPELLLHIAGPRESEAPEIYSEAGGFLAELFAARCER